MDDFLIDKDQIIGALTRLGELAQAHGLEVKLGLVGGAVMVLEYDARKATHDVDAVILAPSDRRKVFELARIVAQEMGWPDDWLNDDAEQFIDELRCHCLFTASGIEAHAPTTAQMLALKLSAWRRDVDINDAAWLLRHLRETMPGGREEIWRAVRPFLVRGCEATAEGALNDSWNNLYGYD